MAPGQPLRFDKMRTNLGPEDVADLLEAPLVAILATRRPDDTTLLSPVWFEWRDGGFNVWAAASDKGKVRHIERDPRVSIVVANSDWPYKGIEVRGEARLSEDGFFDILGRTARRYFGDEAGSAFAASYTAPGLVIRIEPGVLRAWDYADEA
jgi:PPOX class probable F420-dependent enzyme